MYVLGQIAVPDNQVAADTQCGIINKQKNEGDALPNLPHEVNHCGTCIVTRLSRTTSMEYKESSARFHPSWYCDQVVN